MGYIYNMNRYCLLLLLGFGMKLHAQLTTTTMTPAQLVQNVLLGGGVTVSNITYTGYSNAIGSFHLSSASTIGFQDGILLTTGTVLSNDPTYGTGKGPQGPNDSNQEGVDNFTPGDVQLAALATTSMSDLYNAAVLEFDFVPHSDSIEFNYVFGSEEYPEWVCSQFNDVMGFFITGPKPAGGNYNNFNLATIPGTTYPVAINTVNPGFAGTWGSSGGCMSTSYSFWYVDNAAGNMLQYDGYTKKFKARTAVICGSTYHFKIGIADVGDGIYDSGVFIESGSFSGSGSLQVTEQVTQSADNNTINEGCGQAVVTVTRPPQSSQQADTVFLSFSGTATFNTDYTVSANPSSYVVLPAGQTSVSFTVQATADGSGTAESMEDIHINASAQMGSCMVQIADLALNINNVEPLELVTMDTTVCIGSTLDLFAFASGGSNNEIRFQWQDASGAVVSGNSQLNIPSVSGGYYVVSASDDCVGSVSDTVHVYPANENYLSSVYFDVLNNPVDTMATEKCDSVVLIFNRAGTMLSTADTFYYTLSGTAQNTIDYTGLSGSAVFLPNETSKTIPLSIPADWLTEGTETLIVSTLPSNNTRCEDPLHSDLLSVKDLDILRVDAPDTVLCVGETIHLSAYASGGYGAYSYNWSNGLGSGQSHTYTATVPETFVVEVQDGCGITSAPDTCTVSIHYNIPSINVIPDDSACYERDYFFSVNVVNASYPVSYSFQSGYAQVLHSPLASNSFVVADPTHEETIYVQITDRCLNTASDTFLLAIKDCEIVLPTIITNNNDGINEVLYFKNLWYYPNAKLIIFNRWGMKMYESGNYTNDYEPDYTDGTYYYILELSNGKIYPRYFLVTH
jgi:hypothetical protein